MTEEEKLSKKTWQFWCVWEGYDSDDIEFDDSGLEDGAQIDFSEYLQRKLKREESV